MPAAHTNAQGGMCEGSIEGLITSCGVGIPHVWYTNHIQTSRTSLEPLRSTPPPMFRHPQSPLFPSGPLAGFRMLYSVSSSVSYTQWQACRYRNGSFRLYRRIPSGGDWRCSSSLSLSAAPRSQKTHLLARAISRAGALARLAITFAVCTTRHFVR